MFRYLPVALLAVSMTLAACGGKNNGVTVGDDTGTTTTSDAGMDASGEADTSGGGDDATSGEDGGADAGDTATEPDADPTPVALPCRTQWDIGADGLDVIIDFTRDDEGRLIRQERDTGADGTPDSISTWAYTATTTTRSDDEDADGTVDTTTVETFDTEGRPVRREVDNGADGTPDSVEEWEYEENATLYRSGGGDGTFSYITLTTYDAEGRELSREDDVDGDEVFDSKTTWEYDANGNETLRSVDTDNDGTVDQTFASTYDGEGRITSHTLDEGADGTPDSIFTYTWSADGMELVEDQDYDADGTPDFRYVVTFDDAGNMVKRTEDVDADGTPENEMNWVYMDGVLVNFTDDRPIGGTLEFEQTYLYTCD